MTREVISNLPMDKDFTSDWIEGTTTDFKGRERFAAANVQIVWTNVSLNPDATISIEITNDLHYKSVSGIYNIDSSDNSDDTLMIALNGGYRFIRFVYTANSVLTGNLSVIMNYE